MFSQIWELVGAVDILVNNAGINPVKSILELTLVDFQLSLDVNWTSAFLTSQVAISSIIEKNFGRM